MLAGALGRGGVRLLATASRMPFILTNAVGVLHGRMRQGRARGRHASTRRPQSVLMRMSAPAAGMPAVGRLVKRAVQLAGLGCVFRSKSITDSDASRSLIPVQVD